MDASEADRLGRLEREMAILRAEFAKLREHVRGSPHATQAPPRRSTPPPLPLPPRTEAPESRQPKPASAPAVALPTSPGSSAEELIGRCGTIAVATVTGLVGVGIF